MSLEVSEREKAMCLILGPVQGDRNWCSEQALLLRRLEGASESRVLAILLKSIKQKAQINIFFSCEGDVIRKTKYPLLARFGNILLQKRLACQGNLFFQSFAFRAQAFPPADSRMT